MVYLEDLHMTWRDAYNDQPALEVLRDYFITQKWFSARKKAIRQIEDVNFVTCLDHTTEQFEHISMRVLREFVPLGIE